MNLAMSGRCGRISAKFASIWPISAVLARIRLHWPDSDRTLTVWPESGQIRPVFSCIGQNLARLARFQPNSESGQIRPESSQIRRRRPDVDGFWQNFIDFSTNQLPDSGDSWLLACEGQLYRLKDGRLYLSSGENDLHF
jgi:hypothetical protein